MVGTDVAALQINLPLGVDGNFGARTEAAVKNFQDDHSLVVDGIAGVLTQRAVIRCACSVPQKQQRLPSGMLMSIASNESGFAVAAYTAHPDGSGFDLGPFQRSFEGPGTQSAYSFAYSAEAMGGQTAERLRERRDHYGNPWPVDSWYVDHLAEGRHGRFAWQLAVLAHNWPEAADNLFRLGSVHEDPRDDLSPAAWIEKATGGRLKNAREWVCAYIERSTVYVQWPTT
jgi:Putative peptidoglycan binding domain